MCIDTVAMKLYIQDAKITRVRRMASLMLRLIQLNRRLVSASFCRRFCGLCISLPLGLPLALFYNRDLYTDTSCASHRASPATKDSMVRVSRQAIHDLQYWRSLTRGGPRPPSTLTANEPAYRRHRRRLRRHSWLLFGLWFSW